MIYYNKSILLWYTTVWYITIIIINIIIVVIIIYSLSILSESKLFQSQNHKFEDPVRSSYGKCNFWVFSWESNPQIRSYFLSACVHWREWHQRTSACRDINESRNSKKLWLLHKTKRNKLYWFCTLIKTRLTSFHALNAIKHSASSHVSAGFFSSWNDFTFIKFSHIKIALHMWKCFDSTCEVKISNVKLTFICKSAISHVEYMFPIQHFTCEILSYVISHVKWVLHMWKRSRFILEMNVS